FFQAEDGIRDDLVTGVQTCALPICPVAAVIDDHLSPQLIGEDVLASERLADMMFRLTKPYGSTGLASYAISAVDLALWDARGKRSEERRVGKEWRAGGVGG